MIDFATYSTADEVASIIDEEDEYGAENVKTFIYAVASFATFEDLRDSNVIDCVSIHFLKDGRVAVDGREVVHGVPPAKMALLIESIEKELGKISEKVGR